MRHDALRIAVPESGKSINCLHDCTRLDPENPERIDMVTLTVRGVSRDCLEGVKAALSELILPSADQVLPDGFVPRKGVGLNAYNGQSVLLSTSVRFSPNEKDPLRDLVSAVTEKVLNMFAERGSVKTTDITVSFQ